MLHLGRDADSEIGDGDRDPVFGRKMLDKDAADVELRVILDVVKELRDAIFEAVERRFGDADPARQPGQEICFQPAATLLMGDLDQWPGRQTRGRFGLDLASTVLLEEQRIV